MTDLQLIRIDGGRKTVKGRPIYLNLAHLIEVAEQKKTYSLRMPPDPINRWDGYVTIEKDSPPGKLIKKLLESAIG